MHLQCRLAFVGQGIHEYKSILYILYHININSKTKPKKPLTLDRLMMNAPMLASKLMARQPWDLVCPASCFIVLS